MTKPDLVPMGVGEILDRAFQTLRSHFTTLFLTALVGTAPYLLFYSAMAAPAEGVASADETFASVFIFMGLALLIGLSTALVWGALAHQVEQSVSGAPVTVAEGFRNGFRAMLRVIGAWIGAYALFMVLMVPVGLIAVVVILAATLVLGEGPISAVVAGVTVLVPMALMVIGWVALAFLVLPALISEKLGPIGAIRRANDLAKGGRLRVFGTALVAWLVVVLPAIGLPFLLGVGAEVWAPEAAGVVSSTRMLLYQVSTLLAGGVTTPFLIAAMVFAYHDRRVRREGHDIELEPNELEIETSATGT